MSDAMNVDPPSSSAPMHRSSSVSAPKPKGILKNPSSDVTSTLSHPASSTATNTTEPNGHQRDSTAHITAANTALNTPPASTPIVPVQPVSNTASSSAHQSSSAVEPQAGMTAAQRLHWDEASLEAAAAQGGGKMKITEPKTPYVRYNAELDKVENMEDIPNFELSGGSGAGGGSGSNSVTSRSPHSVISDLAEPSLGVEPSSSAADAGAGAGALGLGSAPTGERRPSAPSRSSSRSVSIASGSASRRSSRASEQPSVDFEGAQEIGAGGVGGSALDMDDAEDEDDPSKWDPERRESHERFAALRNRHYSNEAEAMKRAAELMKQEDEEDEDAEGDAAEDSKADGIDEDEDEDGDENGNEGLNGRQPNGIVHEGQGPGTARVPPPVPEVPAQYRS